MERNPAVTAEARTSYLVLTAVFFSLYRDLSIMYCQLCEWPYEISPLGIVGCLQLYACVQDATIAE